MGITLEFETPPAVSLASIAMKRGRRHPPDEPFSSIEATARRLVPNTDAYARLCGFPASDVLPITYCDGLARGLQLAVLTHAAFPLRLFGIIHTEQVIEQRRAIYANEALSGRAWVAGPRVARNGGEFDLHTVIAAGGEEVWHGVTTILSRELAGDGVKRPRQQEPSWTPSRSVIWPLPADVGRRYAAVTGDHNPIHLWPVTARLFGFKRPIAHGWWALARTLAEMDQDVPAACRIHARFSKPMPMPGTLHFASGPLPAGGHAFALRRRELCLSGEVHGC